MNSFRTMCFLTIFGILQCGQHALGQTSDPNAAPAPAAASPAAPAAELLKPAELDGLVAPIALYPDTLLANILMAASYPLEVVRADRWLKANGKLQGDALKAAAEQQDWDASVKALVAAPSVLQMMSERIEWTQKLGEAFVAQQQDVMDAVQRLRSKAYDRQKLSTTKEQVVTVRQEQNRPTIFIEPAVPDTVYVPYYEPAVVYGDWPYADYPPYPYYWGYPDYIAAGVIATGIVFGTGYALGRWARGGYWGGGGYWSGSHVNWRAGGINVNRGARVERWQHSPAHHQGARYNNSNLQQRFGNPNQRPAGGRDGLGQGANRPNFGDRAKGIDRAGQTGAGKIAGDRQIGNLNRRAAGSGGRANRIATRPAFRAPTFRPARVNRGAVRLGGGGNRPAFRGGGGFRGAARAGGGPRGGGGAVRRAAPRRSDIALKHDIVLLGHLQNGLGYYRFAYNGSDKAYVGVMAQEVSMVRPDAVERGRDGYLRVYYDRLGVPFQTFGDWAASGGRIPSLR